MVQEGQNDAFPPAPGAIKQEEEASELLTFSTAHSGSVINEAVMGRQAAGAAVSSLSAAGTSLARGSRILCFIGCKVYFLRKKIKKTNGHKLVLHSAGNAT